MPLEILNNPVADNYLKPGWYKVNHKDYGYIKSGSIVHIIDTVECDNMNDIHCQGCKGLLKIEHDNIIEAHCFSWNGGKDRHNIFKPI